MASTHLPRTDLLIIELRAEGKPTYTYATNLHKWRDEAVCKCAEHGPRTVHMFHWGKRDVFDVKQWVLITHEEFRVDCF